MRSDGYQTSQRQAIIICLSENEGSTVTVADILSFLRKNGNKANRATVYRNLERLAAEGVVLRFPTSDGQGSCFQLARLDGPDCHEHLHLKCSLCGKVIHLDCDFMEKLEHHIEEKHGFSMNFGNSIIYGVCSECRQRASLEKKDK